MQPATRVLVSRLLPVGCVLALAVPAAATAHHRPTAAPRPPVGVWLPGDLHVHTIYGHDTCITPTTAWDPTQPDRSARRACSDPYTVSFTPRQRLDEALQRGLGFVALTDHNNVLNQSDPEVLAWERAHPGFVVVPGYENSQPGHVQMLGARSCYDNTGAVPDAVIQCDGLVSDTSAAGETQLATALRATGGVFQVNHPSDGNWPSRFGWDVVPDTVEVWNIGPWAYQHPFPASNDNDAALRYYDGFLDRGFEVGATGGSDSHWVATDAAQGVGEPTTWVFARKPTIEGVLDGLREHHTFVSALPPVADGPQLFLEADANQDGVFETIAGGEVPTGAQLRVRVTHALPGSLLRIVTDTGQTDVPLNGADSYEFVAGEHGVPAAATYVRAELLLPDAAHARRTGCDPVVGSQTTACRDNLLMEALTSPIFVR